MNQNRRTTLKCSLPESGRARVPVAEVVDVDPPSELIPGGQELPEVLLPDPLILVRVEWLVGSDGYTCVILDTLLMGRKSSKVLIVSQRNLR